MSGLEIPDHVVRQIDRHARDCLPEECCGVIIGVGRTADSIWPTTNHHPGPRTHRYAIEPAELLAAHLSAREHGREIIAYYHSHPDASATPSAHDFAEALPGVSYLIVGLRDGRVYDRRAWRLRDDAAEFEEERLIRGTEDGTTAEPGRDQKI